MQIGAKNYADESYRDDVVKLDFVHYDFYRGWRGDYHGDGTGDGYDITSLTAEILSRNPNIIMCQYGTVAASYRAVDGSAEADQAEQLSNGVGPNGSDWWGRNTSGQQVTWQYNGRYHTNYTNFVTPDAQGRRWPQWKVDRDKSVFYDPASFNAVYLDNFRHVDWDDSGNIDYNQDGSYEPDSERDARYRQACVDMVARIHEKHPGKPIIGNIIMWISYNYTSPPAEYDQLLDGGFAEGLMGETWSPEGLSADKVQNAYGWWARMMEYYKHTMEWTKGTHSTFHCRGYVDDYQWARYGLCSCLMHNGFFCYSNHEAYYGHPIAWFDEFDYDLGQPTTGPFTIDDPPYQDGCYLREFENGLAVVNPRTDPSADPDGSPTAGQRFPVVVILPDPGAGNKWQLLDAADYSNQDPITNNGADVTQITLDPGDGRIIRRVPDLIIVQDNGSDSGNGSEAQPFATLEAAIAVATPGDTIEMRKSGGGTWTYNNYVTITNRHGAANNEIVIRVRAGDRVNVYPTSVQSRNVFEITGCSYLRFDGSVGAFYWGDRSLYTYSPTGQSDTYPYQGPFDFYNCQYIHLKQIHWSGGSSYNGAKITSDASAFCSYFWLEDCTGRNHGTHPDQKDGLTISGHHIKVTGGSYNPCGGHSGVYFNARNLVVRNVVFNNDWPEIDVSDRAFSINMQDYQPPWRYNVPPWGPALMEGCFLQNVGTGNRDSAGGEADNAYKMGQWGLIWRYNFETDCPSEVPHFIEGLLGTVVQTSPYYDHTVGFQRTYNNTHYNRPNIQYTNHLVNDDVPPYKNYYEIQFMNNVHADMDTSGFYNWKSEHVIWWREAQRTAPGPYSDHWRGARWDSNIFDFTGFSQDDGSAQTFNIHFEVNGDPSEDRTTSYAEAEATWPNTFMRNDLATPSFVNLAARVNVSEATLAAAKAGMQLAPTSIGKGDARHMAEVTASSTGSVISLSDVFWIYDGFGLEYYGEQGDYLAFYDSTGNTLKGIRRCISNNRKSLIADGQTPQITVNLSINLTAGDIVFPVKKDGSTVIRDRGAPETL
jgi:hypothetical protein